MMGNYLDKWKTLFPEVVGGTKRPLEAISDQEEFNTNGFPQFIAQDPVRYDLQNAFLKQFLSNDAWLWVKQQQANQALDKHKGDAQAHPNGISGNAASATKLQTPRSLNLSGAVMADAATFDGTADATINVKTLDATKLKGTAPVSTTGNAATASKLATPRTLSLTGKAAGSTTFDGSANATINVTSVNADTASKLSTARKISITGNATGSTTFDGTSDVNINTTVNESKHATAADTLKSSPATETSTVARPVWLSWEGDNTKQTVSPNLTYTCSTKTLKAANFKGHLAGNADSATKATQDTNGRAFTDTNAYMHISALANNTDFNNVKTTGIYYCTGNTYSNRPHNSWGILTVYYIGTVKQEYRPDNEAVYYTREYDNTKWGAWSKVNAANADTATNASHATNADSATTATNVSGKIYYSSDSPSVATNKLFTVKQAHKGDDNVPNNGLVIQSGPTGAAYNGKLYITDNGGDGVWIGGVASGKEVGWTRLVENKGSWNINSATATKLQTPRTISLTGNASGSGTFDGSGNVSINTTVSQAANAERIRGESFWSNDNNYLLIGTLTIGQNGGAFGIKIQSGNFFNDGIESFSREASLYFRTSNGSTAKYSAYAEYHRYGSAGMNFFINETSDNTYDIYLGPLMWSGNSICIPILSTACSFDKKYTNVSALPTGAKQVNSYQLVYTDTVNNYAPTKTGSGASGTWGINISGTATNADKLDGYHASDLFRHLGGNQTPVITDIFDRAGTIDMSTMSAADKATHKANINKAPNMTQNIWNNGSGIHAYGGDADMAGYNRGTLKLTQSYKNFDKILVVGVNDRGDLLIYKLWDVWALANAFASGSHFQLFHGGDYWFLYSSTRKGTNTNYVLSTDTVWSCQDQNSGIVAIYGIKY